MTFLLDQGLPRSACERLHALGYAAEHVGSLGMARSSDDAILKAAQQRGAIVVTLDADFHMLLAEWEAASPTVIRIREQGLNAAELAELIARLVHALEAAMREGAVISATRAGFRMRRLPI